MERYRLLSITLAVQIGEVHEEVDRGVSNRTLSCFEAVNGADTFSLPFYQDKLHEEKVFQRFNEILTKVSITPWPIL
jgi:hypothetical protein